MQPQRGPLTLSQKLQIISAHNNGRKFAELSSNNSMDESAIECILTRSARLKKGNIKQSRRRHLQ